MAVITTGGKSDCLAIPPRAFSSGDQRAYCRLLDTIATRFPKHLFPSEHHNFEQQLIDDMGRFIAFLNRAETWQVVCEIAAILVNIAESPAVFDGAILAPALAELHVT